MGKVTLGHAFLRALRFSPFGVIPPMVHVYLHLNISFISMTRGAMPGNLQTKQRSVGYREAMDGKVNSRCSFINLVFKCHVMHLMVMQSPASHQGNPVGSVSERFVVGKIAMGFGRGFLQALQVFRQY
jgi:hypothetical protein